MLSVCAGCGNGGASPCQDCVAQLLPAGPPCPAGVDSCVAAFLFAGVGRTLVSSLKYRNQRQSLPWMAAALASCIEIEGEVDIVTWVPTTQRRRRQRGFDQAELLARRVARRLTVPARRLLVSASHDAGGGQAGLNATQRFDRVAFKARRNVAGQVVLLIDDVLTTGSSLEAAAGVLRGVGALEVHAAALAFTPAPADRVGLNAS